MPLDKLFNGPLTRSWVKRAPKRPKRHITKRIAKNSYVRAYRVHAVVFETFSHHAYVLLEFNGVVIEPAGRAADSQTTVIKQVFTLVVQVYG